MCGRYTLTDTDDLEGRFGIGAGKHQSIRPNYNVAPGQVMPVILEEAGKRRLEIMKWGLVPAWAKDEKIGFNMINARAETVAEKPAYRGPFKSGRCLIPASGFYEWMRKNGTKHPQYIYSTNGLLAFAGLCTNQTFTIITTTPNSLVKPIHDRMPVILPRAAEDDWLNEESTPKTLLHLLHPIASSSLKVYPVSSMVNSPAHNSPELIEQISTTPI